MTTNHIMQDNPSIHRLYIFGAGGHGREVAWVAEQAWKGALELEFLVDDVAYVSKPVNGVSVRVVHDVIARRGDGYVVAVGDSALRRRASALCLARGLRPITVAHPRVEASRFVRVGAGSVISVGSILTTNVSLGEHVHVNLNCTLSHDVCVGDYSTLSPGVHVCGHVQIGRDVFIGTGASIINGSSNRPLVVGDGAVIAAGACVTESIEAGALVAGVPAVRKR